MSAATDVRAAVRRAAPRARKRPLRYRLREYLAFVLFVAPSVIAIGVFIYRPMILNIAYSRLNWRLGSLRAKIIGLDNYQRWATDPDSLRTVVVTVVFTLAAVAGSMALGFGLALVLNKRIPGVGFVRPAVFAPYVLSGVGVGLLWLFIFDPTYGALGGILRIVGLSSPHWYTDGKLALVMVIVVYLWQHAGYAGIVYLAGLQALPEEILESASIDGARSVAVLRQIVWPLLSPVTFFLLVTITLDALKQFDLIKIMTDGGPLGSTRTLMFQVYEEAFINFRAGYSATIAVVLFAIMLIIALVQVRFLERRVHYA